MPEFPATGLAEALTFSSFNNVKGSMAINQTAPLNVALSSFDSLPDSARVRVPIVAALHGVSVVTAWRWARDGRIPAPSKRGGVTSWNVGELRRSLSLANG